MSTLPRKEFYFLFIIIITGILFRMAYLEDFRLSKVFQPLPFSDSYFYAQRAQDIIDGKFLTPKIFISWPLYAYILAVLFKLSGSKILFVYVVQFLMGAGNAVAVYCIGRRLFNPVAGFLSSMLCLWYGIFMFYEGLLVYTAVSLLFNSLLVLFILQSVEKMTKGRSFGAGIFLGICSFVQGNMMLFGLAFPVWAVWRSGDDLRRGIVSGIVFCAGFALVAGAAAGANYLSDRNVVFFSRNAGLNVFLGNNPEANGIFHCPSYLTATQEGMYRDARITAQMAAGRELRVSEISRFWLRRSFAFMREQPRIFLRLLARKFLLLFTPREFFSDPEFKYVASSVRILKILFLDLRFILPLAIAGMVLAARRFRDCFLLYAATGAVLANIPVFYFQTKLRIGAVPFLAVFAGYALYAVGKMFREKKIVPGVLLAAGITALGFFLVRPVPGEKRSVPSGAFDEYRSHFDTAMYYETRGDYVRALEELKRARAVRTDSHLLFCLGAVSYQLKDFRGAEEYFHQTIQAFPLYIDAYYNLGFLLNEEGRFEEAAGILRTAVSFDPDDTGVRFELARACEGRKDYACARIHLREALARGTALSPAEKDLVARKLAALP